MRQTRKLLRYRQMAAYSVAVGLLTSLVAMPIPAWAGAEAAKTPVVVELFTSEGCSSCPPADVVLSDLERRQPVSHIQIIALGEHVDYWDRGGWADPFSNHNFSLRQNDYANHFHNDTVYTPQMIVDGHMEFVGSDRDQALQAIAQAARTPQATVKITRLQTTANTIPLQVFVSSLPRISGGDAVEVVLALTEDNLTSHVKGGENGGRILAHTAVVRQMRILGVADARNRSFTTQVTLTSGWRRENLHAVVFVQERGSRRILGAATTDLI